MVVQLVSNVSQSLDPLLSSGRESIAMLLSDIGSEVDRLVHSYTHTQTQSQSQNKHKQDAVPELLAVRAGVLVDLYLELASLIFP